MKWATILTCLFASLIFEMSFSKSLKDADGKFSSLLWMSRLKVNSLWLGLKSVFRISILIFVPQMSDD